MKNSIFITTSNIGMGTGGGAVCYHICHSIKKTTNLVGILASCDSFPSDLKTTCISTRPDFFKQLPNPFLSDYFAYWNLPHAQVDIAHFYGSPFGITARELKKRNPHCIILIDIPAHNLEHSIEEHQKLMGGYPYIHMVDPFLWPIFCEHVRQADIIIAPSKLSIDYMRNSETFYKILGYRQKDIPIFHIPHGTILPPREEIKPFPEKYSIATVSQNGPDKGQVYLLSAWRGLQSIFPPDLGYSCTIAGYNTESWEPFIKQYDIKNIKVGYVKNVADIYNNCTVYIHPSVSEGWGITVLEAMSYGRPVVVTEGTGAVEVVEDGRNGFIIPIRDDKAIAGCIRWFHDNPEETKKMGEAARKTAEEYSWSDICEQYIKLYEEL